MADIVTIEPTFIGSPAIGVDTYQLPSAAMTAIGDIINATWNLAAEKDAAATTKVTTISGDVDALIADPSGMEISATSITEHLPTDDLGLLQPETDVGQVSIEFSNKFGEVGAFLEGKFSNIFSNYFSHDSTNFGLAETFLQGALNNPGAGIPASVQLQIIADDHARISADKQRAQANVMRSFAAKGFPLPPDTAAAAVVDIEMKAQDEMAESSRKLAIMSVENMKWAVDKMLDLRKIALSTAGDYVRSLASAPDSAARLADGVYSSAAAFMNARTSIAEMRNKVSEFNASNALQAAEKNQAMKLQLIDEKVRALLAELQSTMQQATALYNNLHVSTGMSVSGGVNGSVISQ